MRLIQIIFDTRIPESGAFPFFSFYHTIPMLLGLILIYLMVKNREYVKANARKIKLIIGILLFIIIGTKHLWYYASDFSYIKEALPFYLCRLTFFVTIFSFLFNSKKLNFVIVYQGTIGGIMALLVPDISGYIFPHVFYLIYFSSHTLLIAAALTVFIADDFNPSFEEFRKIIIYNIIFVIVATLINAGLGTNYAYTSHLPASINFLGAGNLGLIYKFSVFLAMTALSLISHIIYNTKFLRKLQS